MNIGIIGCGYVFDHYMATMHRHPSLRIVGVTDLDAHRRAVVAQHYGLATYPSNEALLADPSIDIVVNLTSIPSHDAVTRAALLHDKHVYSEKPFVTDMAVAEELVAIAARRGLKLSCAPSNALSATSQTMWKAVEDGAIGTPRLVYAEFDDNPVPLMAPEGWRSRTGAPWPFTHEYEMGCTWEHIGYHLAWMCAILGPVRTVTAFSKQVLPEKTSIELDPPGTPDFSVACLDFESGTVGRVTCSIVAPLDHRMRIIGDRGMLEADTYRHYTCPVHLERFTKLSLNARKARSVRTSSLLRRAFTVGGRRVPLVDVPSPLGHTPADGAAGQGSHRAPGGGLLARLQRREVGQQDKVIGIAELAAAVEEDRAPFPAPDFVLHVTELTLAIQAAGPSGASHRLGTSFVRPKLPAAASSSRTDYAALARPSLRSRLTDGLLDRMHRR